MHYSYSLLFYNSFETFKLLLLCCIVVISKYDTKRIDWSIINFDKLNHKFCLQLTYLLPTKMCQHTKTNGKRNRCCFQAINLFEKQDEFHSVDLSFCFYWFVFSLWDHQWSYTIIKLKSSESSKISHHSAPKPVCLFSVSDASLLIN